MECSLLLMNRANGEVLLGLLAPSGKLGSPTLLSLLLNAVSR
jgi:hypothetical protein